MNKTFYFSKDEVKEALSDYVSKRTNYSEFVDPEEFTLQCLTEENKNVDFDIVSIFNMDFG